MASNSSNIANVCGEENQKKPFYRQACRFCGDLRHGATVLERGEDGCPVMRRKAYEKREAARQARQIEQERSHEKCVANRGPERKAAWEARQTASQITKLNKEDELKKMDVQSDCGASTVASSDKPSAPTLTIEEEKEARKLEKKLREIAKLEGLLAQGSRLDVLQKEKIAGRADLEGTLVMMKVNGGWARRSC